MLPIHPQPNQDELLSSWMVRLAFSNGLPLHTFYSSLLAYKYPIWSRDSDRHPPKALLEILQDHTAQPLSKLGSLTLGHYEGFLFESLPLNGDVSWLLPAGIYHRTRRRAGLQFCPICLRNDFEAYYRRSWRLALCSVCKDHNCLMMEHCPVCSSLVAFHRHGIGRLKPIRENALRFCHFCGFDLGETEPISVCWFDDTSKQGISSLLNMLERSDWDGGPLQLGSSLSFFNGFRNLLGAVSGRNGAKVRAVIGQQIHTRIDCEPRQFFEYQHATFRCKILAAGMWLLDDWPSRFVDIFSHANFTRSRFVDNIHALPFWLETQINQNLDTRPYLPSPDEFASAISYLHDHNMALSTENLSNLLGVKRDVARRGMMQWKSKNSEN